MMAVASSAAPAQPSVPVERDASGAAAIPAP
jgi:hypothetical protein